MVATGQNYQALCVYAMTGDRSEEADKAEENEIFARRSRVATQEMSPLGGDGNITAVKLGE